MATIVAGTQLTFWEKNSISTTGSRFQILDPLRGLSALAVVVYHALTDQLPVRSQVAADPGAASIIDWVIYVLSSGFLGVPVFFMISGYCISAAAQNHIERQQPASRFLYRRFIRIYPPYWTCLAFCILVSQVPGTRVQLANMTVTQWLGNLLLFETYRHWFLSPAETHQILGAAWTLCYEEQFYLFTFLLITLLPKRVSFIFALVTAFVVANTYNLNIGPLKKLGDLNCFQLDLGDLLFDESWLLFASGIGLFHYRNSRSRLKLAFPVLLALFAWWEMRQMDWYAYRYVSRVSTAVVALGLCGAGNWDAELMRLKVMFPLRWLGERSYSIYLLHMPLTFFVLHQARLHGQTSKLSSLLIVTPMSVLLSVSAGHLFYQIVERRFIPGKPLTA